MKNYKKLAKKAILKRKREQKEIVGNLTEKQLLAIALKRKTKQ